MKGLGSVLLFVSMYVNIVTVEKGWSVCLNKDLQPTVHQRTSTSSQLTVHLPVCVQSFAATDKKRVPCTQSADRSTRTPKKEF